MTDYSVSLLGTGSGSIQKTDITDRIKQQFPKFRLGVPSMTGTGTVGTRVYTTTGQVRDRALKMGVNNAAMKLNAAMDPGFQMDLITRINTVQPDAVANYVGQVFTLGNNQIPIDSKEARRSLNATGWYKAPSTLAQYKAKAAIRYAQQWNRYIRAWTTFDRSKAKDESHLQRMIALRQYNQIPEVKYRKKVLTLLKKYPNLTIIEAAMQSRDNVEAFRQKQDASYNQFFEQISDRTSNVGVSKQQSPVSKTPKTILSNLNKQRKAKQQKEAMRKKSKYLQAVEEDEGEDEFTLPLNQ